MAVGGGGWLLLSAWWITNWQRRGGNHPLDEIEADVFLPVVGNAGRYRAVACYLKKKETKIRG